MRLFLMPLIVVGLAACSTSANERDKLIERIESRLVLPREAKPMGKYERYYSRNMDGSIIAIFIIHSPDHPEQVRSACNEFAYQGAEPPFPCPMNGGDLRLINPGEKAWVENPVDMPGISGGGCNQVTIEYETDEERFVRVECNGDY